VALACPTCGVDMGVAQQCPACGSSLFAALARDSTPRLVLPVLGDLMRFSRNTRLLLAAGVSLAFSVLVVLVSALLGSAF
jgi:uncharacterized protein (DUF983 family)